MTLRFRRQVLSGLVVLSALTQTTCLRFGSVDPVTKDITLTVVIGDGQFGPPSQFLIDSLTVAVRTEDGDLPADGVLVDWEIPAGPVGAQLSRQTTPSDSAGLARVRPGEVRHSGLPSSSPRGIRRLRGLGGASPNSGCAFFHRFDRGRCCHTHRHELQCDRLPQCRSFLGDSRPGSRRRRGRARRHRASPRALWTCLCNSEDKRARPSR